MFLLGPLALSDVHYESHTLIPACFEESGADQHGHAAAVFPEVLLLERLDGSGRLCLCDGPFVAVTPFRRSQVRPAQATRDEIFTPVLHHVEKRFIGVDNLTFRVPDDDPHDIGVGDLGATYALTLPARSSELKRG